MTTKESTRLKTFLDFFLFIGIGVLLGLALVAFRETRAVYNNIVEIHRSLDLRLSGSETQALLARAGIAGLGGDYEEVKSILVPNLQKFTDPAEAAQAYSLLGKAEFNLGHPQLAAGYFEKVYINNPNSANLYALATAYDAGGNLDTALEKYSLFIATKDQSATPDMLDFARQRIDQILVLQGVGTPSNENP